MNDLANLRIVRVRRPTKFRLLEVVRVRSITPHLTCVTLAGPELDDFETASFDDHVKVFFPPPGAVRPPIPQPWPNGPAFPEDGPKPVARDFTPRRFDRAARELDLEFVLHHPGPASQWAEEAATGRMLGVGGPRGSFIIPTGFDWHLLIGDDTALPAIARRLEELPAGAKATAIIEAPDEFGWIDFRTRADLRAIWRYRSEWASASDESPLLGAVRIRPCRPATAMCGRQAKRRRSAPCVGASAASAASTSPGSAPPPTGSAARSQSTKPTITTERTQLVA